MKARWIIAVTAIILVGSRLLSVIYSSPLTATEETATSILVSPELSKEGFRTTRESIPITSTELVSSVRHTRGHFVPSDETGPSEVPGFDYYRGLSCEAAFTSTGAYYTFLKEDGAVAIYVDFIEANEVSPVGRRAKETRYNFLIGNDPTNWEQNIQARSEIIYENLWSGIDLVYYGTENGLKYEFIVAPEADPDLIKLSVSGVDSLIAGDGCLTYQTTRGDIIDTNLVAYESETGRAVGVDFAIYGNQVSYSVLEPYSGTLVIDPLLYSTYMGSTGDERAYATRASDDGYQYATGYTLSKQFPTTAGAYNQTYGGKSKQDVAVVKTNGSHMMWGTFIGGWDDDIGYDLALDSTNNVYVTGSTKVITGSNPPNGFPTTSGAYDEVHNDERDAFALKLSADGSSLTWSTYLGGNVDDTGQGIALDSSNNVYVTGYTDSPDFPATGGAYDEAHAGDNDAFVAKLSADGTALTWATYLGTLDDDQAEKIAVNSTGCAHITGKTDNASFPLSSDAWNSTVAGTSTAFLTALSADGASVEYSTFLGGINEDQGKGIALLNNDSAVWVVGQTKSTDFASLKWLSQRGNTSTYLGGSWDGWALCFGRLESTPTLLYGSYIGGSDEDGALAVAVDAYGAAYVIGQTKSTDMQITAGANSTFGGSRDPFLTVLDWADADGIVFSEYHGGAGDDWGHGVSVSDAVYLSGLSDGYFPVLNAFNATYSGSVDWTLWAYQLDAQEPLLGAVTAPPVESTQNVTIFLDVAEGRLLDVGVSHVNISFGGVNYTMIENGLGNYTFTNHTFANGTFSFTIYAWDLAGNLNSTTATVEVDGAPIILHLPDVMWVPKFGASLKWNVSDLTPDLYWVDVDGVYNDSGAYSSLANISWDTPWVNGSYTVVFHANDSLGREVSLTQTLYVGDNDQPTVAAVYHSGNITYVYMKTWWANATVTDANSSISHTWIRQNPGAVRHYSSDNGTHWVGSLEDLAAGTYYWQIRANDTNNQTSAPWGEFPLIISQASLSLALYLDRTAGSIDLSVESTVNITASRLSVSGPVPNMRVYVDGSLQADVGTAISTSNVLLSPTVGAPVNVTAQILSHDNYTAETLTYLVFLSPTVPEGREFTAPKEPTPPEGRKPHEPPAEEPPPPKTEWQEFIYDHGWSLFFFSLISIIYVVGVTRLQKATWFEGTKKQKSAALAYQVTTLVIMLTIGIMWVAGVLVAHWYPAYWVHWPLQVFAFWLDKAIWDSGLGWLFFIWG